MKSFFLILMAISGQVWAEQELDYNRFKDRFVTTVKEAQVEGDFLKVPQVKECVQEITEGDLADPTIVKKKQADSAKCVRQQLSNIPAADLEELAKKLELEAFGVIKGQSSTEIINYFSSRLEKALYGVGPDGKPAKLKDQRIVDQKVFADIYETQLGKNILLEISQYCYNRLNKGGASTRFSDINGVDLTTLNLSGWTDIPPSGGMGNNPSGDIYQSFMTDVVGSTNQSPQVIKDKLSKIFSVCTAMAPKLCDQYEKCLCKFKKTNDSSISCDDTGADNSCASAEPTVGQHSCHVVARLRGYRTNLQAVKQTQTQFEGMRGGTAMKGLGTSEAPDSMAVYDRKGGKEDESIDALTSLSSGEVEKIVAEDKAKADADEFAQADCANQPESPACEKFFYKKDEVVKFENAALGYNAATEVELAKIKTLEQDTKKLEEYLHLKGYFDLAEKLKAGGNSTTIVQEAQQRFETEREATFKEMSAAFDRKQLVTGTPTEKTQLVNETKSEIENRGKSFQQLMHFNNVVTSVLELKRRDDQGNETVIGTNVKTLEREIKGMGNSQGGGRSQSTLTQLVNVGGSGQGGLQNGDNPLVDITFLDSVLGNKEAQQRQQQQQNGGTNSSTGGGQR